MYPDCFVTYVPGLYLLESVSVLVSVSVLGQRGAVSWCGEISPRERLTPTRRARSLVDSR